MFNLTKKEIVQVAKYFADEKGIKILSFVNAILKAIE